MFRYLLLSYFIPFSFICASPFNVSVNGTPKFDCPFSTKAGLQYVECYNKMFALLIPDHCSSSQCGIVIDVHGLSMGSDIQDLGTNMRTLGDRYGYAILQPQAKGNPPSTSWSSDDDKDVYAVIVEIIDLFQLDKFKVHFTGFSQGGAMTWRFLYAYGSMFASFAPISMGGVSSATNPPPVRRPVLFCGGTTDGLVPFSSMLQTQKNLVEGWKLIDPQPVQEGDKFKWTRWRSDADDIVFEFVQHDYEQGWPWLGHCFPGSKDLPPNPLLPGQINHNGCPRNGERAGFVLGEIIMEFFIKHPLRK